LILCSIVPVVFAAARGGASVAVLISKSKYMAGVQCLKRLYLLVHSPELGQGKTAADFARFDQGRQVGKLAQQLFPGGVEVRTGNSEEAIRTTQELIANPDTPAIFEAAFEHEGVLVRVDILHRRKDGRWRVIEVKSSASMKDEHVEDVAIQYRVVSNCGLDVASCHLAIVNRGYVFPGGCINSWRFFRIKNLTRKVRALQTKLTFQLRSELRVLEMSHAPDLPVGRHCTNPGTCEFYDHCNVPRPDDHIGYLPYIHASAVEELVEMGVDSICNIPDDYELTEIQRRAASSVQSGKPWFSAELREVLNGLTYPLYFMDFETVNRAIPPFRGMRPYDQLPFQFSVHSQKEPGATLEHHEFLATDTTDPRREFITSLCSVLGKSGSIVVYSAFESQRLAELAAWLPDFADRIKNIQARLWDLLPIVRSHVYHPAFAGSYSIKSVLPALVPGMTYEGMKVADGTDAGLAWESLVRGSLDQNERNRIRKALLDYCGQDTTAMVRLLESLRLS
jgi:predicted RecB family nuclease